MEKELFRTATYTDLPLKVSSATQKFQFRKHLAEVFASVDYETGKVEFFISEEDAEKLKDSRSDR